MDTGIQPANASGRFAQIEVWVPGLRAMRTYQRSWLPRDLVAGLVLCTLLVPQGMAYAELAGLPAITGLYTTVACLVAYAAFGPSPFLVLGPDSALGPMIAAAILSLAAGDRDRAIALAKGAAALKAKLDEAITDMYNDGTLAGPAQRYLSVAQVLPTPTPAPTSTPGPQPPCTDGRALVKHLTQESDMRPGQAFTKGWQVQNTGTCTWNSSYRLVFVSGHKMGGESVAVAPEVKPGGTYDIQINLVAPLNPGSYQGVWQMQNAQGQAFGERLKVEIKVLAAPTPDFPPYDPEKATSIEFVDYFNFLLGQLEPGPDERPLLEKWAKIGVQPGQPFDPGALAPEVRQAVAEGVAAAHERIKAESLRVGRKVNNWTLIGEGFGYRSMVGGKDLLRAVANMVGIYGNNPEEAYNFSGAKDGDGEPLDASKHNYVIHFETPPPVKAFWSVTMYKWPVPLFITNAIKRYSIGDRTPGFKPNEDGSVTIYLQHDSPGPEKEANWLPAPDGPFALALRIYWPAQEILDGKWKPSAIEKS